MEIPKDKITVGLCEVWILNLFHDKCPTGGGIERKCFFNLAAKYGLYEKGTYGTPMNEAVEKLCRSEAVNDMDGNYAYTVFKLKNREAKA